MKDVLLVTVDCLRADHVGFYNYDRPTTPNIDMFCEAARVYENAYATAPGTTWAFQTLHAGVYPFQINGAGLPEAAGTTVAEAFDNVGYQTGAFGYNANISKHYNYDRGFDEFCAVEYFQEKDSLLKRVGRRVNDSLNHSLVERMLRKGQHAIRRLSTNVTSEYQQVITDKDVVEEAIRWISRQKDRDEPYFVWVHLMDAHTPYSRHEEHLEEIRGDSDVTHITNPSDIITECGSRVPDAVIDAYDAGLRSADAQIGKILDCINQETFVVITGDHGEEFGRFKHFHAASPFSSMTNVPVALRTEKLKNKTVSDTFATHLHIPPTLVSECNITVPEDWMKSPLQQEEPKLSDPIHFQVDGRENEYDPQAGLQVDGIKYINFNTANTGRSDGEALFEVNHMETERENVVAEHSERFEELRSESRRHSNWCRRNLIGDGVEQAYNRDEMSHEIEQNLEDLGYL